MVQNTKPPPKKPATYLVFGSSVHMLLYKYSDTTTLTRRHSTHNTKEEAEAVALALNALSK